MTNNHDADVIVVGAGSAGIVVASRLAEAGKSVLLLEAGEWATGNSAVDNPSQWISLQGSPIDWDYSTEPAAHVGSRVFSWPRGKAVGGCSIINAMIWLRSDPRDFDAWRDAGCEGWSYQDLLPYFRRSEDWHGEPSQFHGNGGEIHVQPDPYPSIAAHAFIEAAEAHGIPFNQDFNGPDSFGVGYYPHSIREGVRESVATAFFPDQVVPGNLKVLTGVRSTRLLFEGTRCVGVEFARGDGTLGTHYADETVVSAGAIESPKLLMLSGIGSREDLEPLGIPVLADLPVGRNLQDHVAALVTVGVDTDLAIDPASPGGEAGVFAHSKPELQGSAPDLQVSAIPTAWNGEESDGSPPLNGITFTTAVARPHSRGRINLRSANAEDPPVIETGYLSEAEDREVLRRGIRLVFDLLEEEPLRSLTSRLLLPGSRPSSEEDYDALIDQTLITYFHPSGTCKMGTGPDSVVDLELRVHGMSGLRVVDASVLPAVPSANIHAAVLAVAERASELLLTSTGNTTAVQALEKVP